MLLFNLPVGWLVKVPYLGSMEPTPQHGGVTTLCALTKYRMVCIHTYRCVQPYMCVLDARARACFSDPVTVQCMLDRDGVLQRTPSQLFKRRHDS